ncbi:hypothetical protein FHR24_001981 [Wenyingzhuangia heitensis]|uniref:Lipoprotein n=1 Tax=Wenyingzhuangia heitensis TaxID=1487859 RepID=A0ABX0UB40_9FLAO|nr:hypothetical protein [Wenyingzhuangia heitensis]NIJ45513.1 hypothetical protein [Wenyingzhuangia heitensis]
MKKLHYFIYLSCTILLFSCKKEPTIYDVIECNTSTNFNHSKTIRDVKNSFEITIGENWKRELYFDDYQSRIYAADTTRSFSSSFIIDITRFKGKIIIEEAFKNKISKQTLAKPRSFIINQGLITFNQNPAYAIYSFQKNTDSATYTIQCYMSNKDYYYLLSAQINGSKNLSHNSSEILEIFNSLKILP